jgi:hypothetical protein
MYLKNMFPRISDAKIKEGVFVGLQTRDLIKKCTLNLKAS